MAIGADVESSLRAKLEAVLPHLDERSGRLVLAAEARSLGRGGIAVVARASGASRTRIAKAWPSWSPGRRRWAGCAGPAAAAAGRLGQSGAGAGVAGPGGPTRRGDPESPLCWTTLSVRGWPQS